MLPKNFIIKSIYPPTILNILGKTYAVGGGVWIKVPSKTTLDEVRKHWIDTSPKIKKYNTNKEFKFKSSTSDREYTVKVDYQGRLTCTCPGFGFRRFCKHINEVSTLIKE